MVKRRMKQRPPLTPQSGESPELTIQFGQLAESLKVMSRSFASIALRLAPSRPKTDMDRITFLNALGLEKSEIAGLIGTTPDTVRAQLSDARSKPRRKRKARGKG